MDKHSGLELLALPEQTTLLLHQKVEPTEIIADMAAYLDVAPMSIETPNTYAIRDRYGGATYYLIKEDGDVASSCLRNECRRNMPYKFHVVNMRTGEQVGEIDSPWACDDCGCGVWCVPFCIPVWCCMRKATWTETLPGKEPRVIAELKKKPLFGCRDFCNKRMDITFPQNSELPPAYMYSDDCDCYRDPCYYLCQCKCQMSSMIFLDEEGIRKPPGRKEGQMDEAPLGRLWDKNWKDLYEPTNSRYPPLEQLSAGEDLKHWVKEIAKEAFTDADTYLVECPSDDPTHKAGLMLGSIMYDMIWRESAPVEGSSCHDDFVIEAWPSDD